MKKDHYKKTSLQPCWLNELKLTVITLLNDTDIY